MTRLYLGWPDGADLRGHIWFWRGTFPFHFVTLPAPEFAEVEAVSKRVTYGWGMIPATAGIGDATWTTSMFAKQITPEL